MTQRVFIAIPLPLEVTTELERIQNQLRPRNQQSSIKWAAPDTIHLTMHFLGDIPHALTLTLAAEIETALQQFHPTPIQLTGLGGFPNVHTPRVLFVGCSVDVKLQTLHTALASLLESFSIPVDERVWQPHLTLARITVPTTLDISAVSVSPITYTASSIEIINSTLTPAGPKYQTIKSIALPPYA